MRPHVMPATPAGTPQRMHKLRRTTFRRALIGHSLLISYMEEILRPGIADRADSANLFAPSAVELVKARAIIGMTRDGDSNVAGLYITVDGGHSAWLHGIRVAHAFRGRGYGTEIVRDACRFARDELGRRRVALTVRCDDTGRPNETPMRTYERCGFRAIGLSRVRISGLPIDRHLGEAGSTFLSLQMEVEL